MTTRRTRIAPRMPCRAESMSRLLWRSQSGNEYIHSFASDTKVTPMSATSTSRFGVVLVSLAIWIYTREASAQVLYDWINSSGGSWHTAANWFPGAGAPPGPNDGAAFGLASTYTVSISEPTAVSDIYIVNGDVAFEVCSASTCGAFTALNVEVSGFGSAPRLTLKNGRMRVDMLLVSNGGELS